jgi:hypothetical protein
MYHSGNKFGEIMSKPIGIVIFYVNVNIEHMEHIKSEELVDMIRENHVAQVTILKERGWEVLFLPCIGEASRVEKINLTKGEEEAAGVVLFYVNVNIEHMEFVNPGELIDVIRENHVAQVTVLKENDWEVLFLPCIGEASRAEKINLLAEDEEETDGGIAIRHPSKEKKKEKNEY